MGWIQPGGKVTSNEPGKRGQWAPLCQGCICSPVRLGDPKVATQQTGCRPDGSVLCIFPRHTHICGESAVMLHSRGKNFRKPQAACCALPKRWRSRPPALMRGDGGAVVVSCCGPRYWDARWGLRLASFPSDGRPACSRQIAMRLRLTRDVPSGQACLRTPSNLEGRNEQRNSLGSLSCNAIYSARCRCCTTIQKAQVRRMHWPMRSRRRHRSVSRWGLPFCCTVARP